MLDNDDLGADVMVARIAFVLKASGKVGMVAGPNDEWWPAPGRQRPRPQVGMDDKIPFRGKHSMWEKSSNDLPSLIANCGTGGRFANSPITWPRSRSDHDRVGHRRRHAGRPG